MSLRANLSLSMSHGELGPSTIVGSAAFNLLVITAVCIVGLPTNESKSVTEFGVFCVTAAWSLWAYVWLVIVLAAWTPASFVGSTDMASASTLPRASSRSSTCSR